MSFATDQDLLRQHPFKFYIRKHRKLFSLGIGSLFFTNMFDAITPLLMKTAIDQIEAKVPTESLFQTVLLFFASLMGLALFRYLWRIFFGQFHHAVADDLRNRIYSKLTTFGPSYFQKHPVGQLMTLISNDVNAFRMGIGPGTLILFDGLFLSSFIIPFMISLSWSWTWKTLILLPLVPFIIQKVEHLIHVRFKVEQEKFAELSGVSQEIISGIRVIKSYAQEKNQQKIYNQKSQDFEIACNRMALVDSLFHPVMEFMVAAGSVILLWVASPEVIRGEITVGTMVAFQQYIQKLIWPMAAFGVGVTMVQQGMASYERVSETLSTKTDIPDNGTIKLDEFKSLEVKNLSFSYPNSTHEVLRNVNFSLRAGESLGIVGPVGAGKTTLAQLICGLWPFTDGQILINGGNLPDVQRASFSRLVSYIPQDTFLFSETVSDNIGFGLAQPPAFVDVVNSTEQVHIAREIETMPEQYLTPLGERGVNLSGGQKQRLTIARALIRRSALYIFDDSLSAVDSKTEKSIVSVLEELSEKKQNFEGTAVILISHRLATLKHAQRILVLNQGRIEAIGSHEELLTKSPTYKELAELQQQGPLTEPPVVLADKEAP